MVKLDPEMRALVDAERFDAVDDAWMSRVETAAHDLDFFLPVLRALLQRQQHARAELLVQLLVEAQSDRDVEAALQVLGALLAAWPEAAFLRRACVETLRHRRADRPSLERLLQHFPLADSADPVRAFEKLQEWLHYDLGRPVFMPTRGCGRVVDINLALSTVRVEFPPARDPASFRLDEAKQLLRVLEHDHFLVQKLDDLPLLQRQAEADPGALLERFFASFASPIPLATLREHLRDVVLAENWNAWWKRARTDRRLAVGPGTRPQCTWSPTAAAASDHLSAQFEAAPPAERVELARAHAGHSDALAAALATGLRRMLHDVPDLSPTLQLEALLLLEQLPAGDAAPDTTRLRALLRRDDAAGIVSAVRERRARERAYELVRTWRDDWPAVYLEGLESESDGRTLGWLYEALGAEPAAAARERSVVSTLEKPARAPRLFLWLCRELLRRPELRARADWRLLRRLLDAGTDVAFKGQRAAVRELFAPGGLAETIVGDLDAEQAAQLLALLGRDVGLEEHTKKELRALVGSRHPALREDKEEPLYVTAAALERKRAEFDQMVRVDIPHNAEEIRKAAAHGDLRENFEYKSARERHEMLSSRAKMLHDDLRRARALDPASIDASAVRVGTRIQLSPVAGNGDGLVLTILGPWDSDPARGVVSYLAPAVAPLLGKHPGDAVRFGEADFVISDVRVWS